MPELHVLRVFTTPEGEHGNPLGVFASGGDVPEPDCQGVASDLGFAETVFIDDPETAEMRIFTPAVELPFAGHPSVGTAWLLRELRGEVAVLRPPAGELRVRYEEEIVWVSARPGWSPPFEYAQHEDPAAVDSLDPASAGEGWVYAWAWDDEEAGRVRARSFVSDAGIPEDEATGSAALALCAQLGKPIQVRQGRGSEIFARPVDDSYVEVGGRVSLDYVRAYPTVESR